jgi:MoaA/NifB/PqqE/SkfB family radical SAM enzyme
MNLLITAKCQKKCSFCFERNNPNLVERDMTLQEIARFLDLCSVQGIPRPNLVLMGGEPTAHPQFGEIINLFQQRKFRFGLFSNLLFPDAGLLEIIIRGIQHGVIGGGLLNASELDCEDRLSIFKRNHNSLMEQIRRKHPLAALATGITLKRDFDLKKTLEYIDFLFAHLDIMTVRLSLEQMAENKEDRFFLKNKETGAKYATLFYYITGKGVPAYFDCKLYPCMFSQKDFFNLSRLAHRFDTCCATPAMPVDITPDWKALYCLCSGVVSVDNILNFYSIKDVWDLLSRKADVFKKNFERINLPADCRNCFFFKARMCDSLCLGCQRLEFTEEIKTEISAALAKPTHTPQMLSAYTAG